MKKRIFSTLLVLIFCLTLLPKGAWASVSADSVFDGGDGSEGNPYLISAAEQLKKLSEDVNGGESYEGVSFRLTQDIDLGGNENNQWTSIGYIYEYEDFKQEMPLIRVEYSFSGIFDGGGHKITGLYINAPNDNYLGLFGIVGASGTVKNLGVDGTLSGEMYVGSIAGQNKGRISNCYSKCNIESDSYRVGGIAGINEYGAVIESCYNAGDLSNCSYLGGIVGYNSGAVTDCYNTGVISGNNTVGGIVGGNIGGNVVNCYNNGKVSGSSYIGAVMGYLSSGTDSNCYYLDTCCAAGTGTSTARDGLEGIVSSLGNEWKYDKLLGRPILISNPEIKGDGGENTPYLVETAEHLVALSAYVNNGNNCAGMYFELAGDIDLGGSETDQWTPIGSDYYNRFSGEFDGGGNTISGLYVNADVQYQALFGYLDRGGVVENLSVYGKVTGKQYVGGIVGCNAGTIRNCINYVEVTGSSSYSQYVGGVAGENYGIVESCFNKANITGLYCVGGVAGYNSSGGTVIYCGNSGNISGDSSVGGVSGTADNGGTTSNSYNLGNVSGNFGVGGVTGQVYSRGTVSGCYNMGKVLSTYSGGDEDIDDPEHDSDIIGHVGGVIGAFYIYNGGASTVENCYYLDNCNAEGTDFSNDFGTSKTSAEFISGEVAWLLQNGQENGGGQVWGQVLTGDDKDGYPVLTNDEDKAVVIFDRDLTYIDAEGNKKPIYSNQGADIAELPEGASITLGDTDLILPNGGTLNKDGSVILPEGSIVEKGGESFTVSEGGAKYDPETEELIPLEEPDDDTDYNDNNDDDDDKEEPDNGDTDDDDTDGDVDTEESDDDTDDNGTDGDDTNKDADDDDTEEPSDEPVTGDEPRDDNDEVEVNVGSSSGKGAPTVSLDKASAESLIKDALASLTDNERKAVESGTKLEVILTSELINSAISAEDIQAVKDFASRSGYKVGQHFNISIIKLISGEPSGYVTELSKPISITLEIPENIRSSGRIYAVICIHNGGAELLEDKDNDPKTITIETNKFSTYSIVYRNAAVDDDDDDDYYAYTESNNSDTDSSNAQNPYTGSETPITAGIVLACITGAAAVAANKKRTK
ncbi:MAG: hypothetical protein J1F28_08585 [Oscillospiraceae bacterium]|nr:hypothetical protein [Oscillospiraceae bacterium]